MYSIFWGLRFFFFPPFPGRCGVDGVQLAGFREGGRVLLCGSSRVVVLLPSLPPMRAGALPLVALVWQIVAGGRVLLCGSSGWWFFFLLHSRPFGAGGFALVGVDGWQGGHSRPFPAPTGTDPRQTQAAGIFPRHRAGQGRGYRIQRGGRSSLQNGARRKSCQVT